jgi:phosphopantetheinyl transferase|tara:strand:- start:313 stop:936 length:624 start_codon:yes stop_codon:yes gene_type:complete
MPLYKHSEIIPNTFLLIWEITETKNMLIKNLKNINQLTLKLSHLKSNSHKLQFLSNLQLMKLKNISFEDLDYNVNGKPELENRYISLSHSFDYSAVTVSDKKVGVDVEKFRSKISKISHKFISANEINLIGDQSIENLTKVWTIKEAVYKAFGFSGIDFKKNIAIEFINRRFTKAFVKINNDDEFESYNIEIFNFSQYICSVAIQST